MITIAETESFQQKITSLLSRDERNDLIIYLAEHPNAGDLIQGTSGIRKLRWTRNSTGKSRDVQSIYYFHKERLPLYLLAAFGGNEKLNISAEEKNSLSTAARKLVLYWRYTNG